MFTNAIAGLVLLALSVGYYLAADAMPASFLDTTVTSAAFPKFLAIGGGFLSVALIVQNLAAWRLVRKSASPSDEVEHPELFNWTAHRRAVGLLAIVAAFVVAIEFVGYPVAIGLLILSVSVYQGYRFSWVPVAVAVAGGLLFWLFFMVLLGVHMPLGIFSQFAGFRLTPFA